MEQYAISDSATGNMQREGKKKGNGYCSVLESFLLHGDSRSQQLDYTFQLKSVSEQV